MEMKEEFSTLFWLASVPVDELRMVNDNTGHGGLPDAFLMVFVAGHPGADIYDNQPFLLCNKRNHI